MKSYCLKWMIPGGLIGLLCSVVQGQVESFALRQTSPQAIASTWPPALDRLPSVDDYGSAQSEASRLLQVANFQSETGADPAPEIAPTNAAPIHETLGILEEDLADQDERLAELEEQVGQRGVVHAMDALKLDLGGFISQTFTSISSDDDFQSSFDLSQFELFIAGEVSEKLTYFTILEFKRQADIDHSDLSHVVFDPFGNDAELELAWFNYRCEDQYQVRVGRFITPHGIINIEHFHPTLLHIPYPMFMRQGEDPTFFPRFLIGAQLHGFRYMGPCEADRFEYNIYTGSQKETGSKFLLGARAAYTFGESGLTCGVNYGYGTHGEEPTDNKYNFGGFDLLYDRGRVLWKNEFFASVEDGADDRLGFYTQPGWRWCDNVILFYRFDYLDPGRGLENQLEHVVGINYLPMPLLRLRAALTLAKFDNRADHQMLQLSTTISF